MIYENAYQSKNLKLSFYLLVISEFYEDLFKLLQIYIKKDMTNSLVDYLNHDLALIG